MKLLSDETGAWLLFGEARVKYSKETVKLLIKNREAELTILCEYLKLLEADKYGRADNGGEWQCKHCLVRNKDINKYCAWCAKPRN